MNRIYVLDANALLDFVEAGPGYRKILELLENALDRHLSLLVSVLNWGEVFYHVWQREGEEKARQTMADLSRLPMELRDVDRSQALLAGEIKARHKIPYVDSVAAALAIGERAVLVTGDRDFEKLGRRIQVLWLPRP